MKKLKTKRATILFKRIVRTLKVYFGMDDLIALIALLLGIIYYILPSVPQFFANFHTELIGIGITVLILGNANQYMEIKSEKSRLILQLGSPDNSLAIEAVRQLRHRTWLYEEGFFKGAYLRNANLKGANLRDANLNGADMWDANFEEADLTGANLKEIDLRDANLQRALVNKANLEVADLRYANLEGVELGRANLSGAWLFKANLKMAYLCYANMTGAELIGAKLNGANLAKTILNQVDLTGADLENASLSHPVHGTGASFRDAKLMMAGLINANLEKADLSNADLSDAWIYGTNLTSANLCRANLKGARLGSKTTWTGAQYDRDTKWPDDSFDPRAKGCILVESE